MPSTSGKVGSAGGLRQREPRKRLRTGSAQETDCGSAQYFKQIARALPRHDGWQPHQRQEHRARITCATNQTFITLGYFITSAALLGTDVGPMAGFEPEEYNQILGLDKQNLRAVFIAEAGYRCENDKYVVRPKVRFPKEEVVEHV